MMGRLPIRRLFQFVGHLSSYTLICRSTDESLSNIPDRFRLLVLAQE